MTKVWATIAGTGVAVALAAALFQQADSRALRQEVAAMKAELKRTTEAVARSTAAVSGIGAAAAVAMTPASGAGEASGVAPAELAKLRDEIAALRKSTQVLAKFAEAAQAAQSVKELQKSADNVAEKIIPAAQLRNVGKATPEAATQSALAAAIAGEVDQVAASLAFTETSRAKADAWFATLSDRVRQEYGTPERVFGLMMARDAAGLTGMQVLGTREISADNVGVRVRFASEQGTKDDTLLLNRSGDGWRLLLPDQAVENMARKVSGRR